MPQIMNIHLLNQLSMSLLSMLIATFIKGSIVFIIVYLALSILKNLSPEFKHLIWLLVICGFVLIPIISMMMPVIWINVPELTEERGELYKAITSVMHRQPTYSAEAQISANQLPADELSTRAGAFLLQLRSQASANNFHWAFWALLIWAAGIIVSFLRVIIGRIIMLHIDRGECLNENKLYRKMLKQLSKRMGVDKEILLLKSTKCGVPFTTNVLKPIIVMPSEVENWQLEKTRAVLSHELAHIRRNDFLTQYIARAVCSIFWFIPFIWVAYSVLHLEQEKASDSTVVHTGSNPADYAVHILELAYNRSRRFIMAGLFLTKGRKMMLEKRILSVLSVTGGNLLKRGGNRMKISRMAISIVTVLAVIVIVGSCATNKQAISEGEFFKVYSGTWVNTDYVGNTQNVTAQKIVRFCDGTFEYYMDLGRAHPSAYGQQTITAMWTNSKGDVWYKAYLVCYNCGIEWYEYGKITDSGNTLEFIVSGENSPIEKWEPDNIEYTYSIYYRQ
jgi:beta-lactamase regulating signal transducer with metallopeptidase domain